MLDMENGEHEAVEITMTPKKVYDNKPIPMAAAILSNSKLHFLKFIYEVVYEFFVPGSFRLCYCDTDSIAIGNKYFSILYNIIWIAFTESEEPEDPSRRANMLSVLLPVVKPEKRENFLTIWEKWFVTEDTVEDEKFPGKLKSKDIF